MNYKRFISLICACLYLLGISAGAVDTPTEDFSIVMDVPSLDSEKAIREYLQNSPTATVVNEYDLWKQEREHAQTVLNSRSSTNDERNIAAEVLNYDPVKHFYTLQAFNEEELKIQGYSSEQIEAIKNFDGSEESIYRASATVSNDLLILERGYKSSSYYVVAKYIFSWSGTPNFLFTDAPTITSDNFYVDSSSSVNKSTAYYNLPSANISSSSSYSVTAFSKCNQHTAGINLPMKKNITKSGVSYTVPCTTGHVTARFSNANNLRQGAFAGIYLHNQITVAANPSLSLTLAGFSPSITFNLSGNMVESNRSELNVTIS